MATATGAAVDALTAAVATPGAGTWPDCSRDPARAGAPSPAARQRPRYRTPRPLTARPAGEREIRQGRYREELAARRHGKPSRNVQPGDESGIEASLCHTGIPSFSLPPMSVYRHAGLCALYRTAQRVTV